MSEHEQLNIHGYAWEERDGSGHRWCRWCGSMHPDDLLTALRAGGVHLDRADMKYGYPHKIYAQSPELGHAKFYTEHLADCANPADFEALADYLRSLAGIDFVRKDDGQIYWRIVGPSYVPGAVSGKVDP